MKTEMSDEELENMLDEIMGSQGKEPEVHQEHKRRWPSRALICLSVFILGSLCGFYYGTTFRAEPTTNSFAQFEADIENHFFLLQEELRRLREAIIETSPAGPFQEIIAPLELPTLHLV